MNDTIEGATAVLRMPASQLKISDVLVEEGALYRVTSVRFQGAPPQTLIELDGVAGRRHYCAGSQVNVLRPADELHG